MLTWSLRIAIGLIALYLIALLTLYLAQRTFIYPASQQRHQPAPEFVVVPLTTEDGLTLAAHFRPPEARKPTVLFFHGNASSLADATAATGLLTVQGYGALLVSYRGYGGNPGEPSEEGFYSDGRAAMAFLRKQGVEPDSVIVIGNSIGSGPATQIASESNPAALVLVSAFTSLPDVAAEALPIFPIRPLMKDRYDNKTKLAALTLPVLIQHGTADTVVPFSHGQRLSQLAPSATFQQFEGTGHELAFREAAHIAQSEWLAQQGL